jgi:hypothetical protein
MKTNLVLLFLLCSTVLLNGCTTTTLKAQNPPATSSLELLSGSYTYWSEGQLWAPGQDGTDALPSGVPNYIPKVLYDSGTFEADGKGSALQCGGGAWGTWATPINCVTIWTYEFGKNESGQPINPRLGLINSNQGDKATIACTQAGRHCVMTSHGVGWAWTQVLDKE